MKKLLLSALIPVLVFPAMSTAHADEQAVEKSASGVVVRYDPYDTARSDGIRGRLFLLPNSKLAQPKVTTAESGEPKLQAEGDGLLSDSTEQPDGDGGDKAGSNGKGMEQTEQDVIPDEDKAHETGEPLSEESEVYYTTLTTTVTDKNGDDIELAQVPPRSVVLIRYRADAKTGDPILTAVEVK